MNTARGSAGASSNAVKWVALVVVLLLGVALVVGLAEAAVRLRQLYKHGTALTYSAMYRTDDNIGLRVLSADYRSDRININSIGFRGPEVVVPKPKSTVRLAFLGASTTFCAEVSGDKAVWPSIVSERLRQSFPDTAFDFINGGVPGYTVSSSRKNLQHRVAALEPDIVVVYHGTNDLSGDLREQATAAGFVREVDSNRQSWLERNSLLWDLVVKNLRVMKAQRGTGPKLRVNTQELGSNFQAELSSLLNEAAQNASRVAVVTFVTRLRPEQSPEEQRQSAVSAFVYTPFMTTDGLLAGYRRYNEIITDVASSEGALLIGGANAIRGDAEHFVDTVHFTDVGSRAMAERVYRALVQDAKTVALIQSRSSK